jgi:hypothetical protein
VIHRPRALLLWEPVRTLVGSVGEGEFTFVFRAGRGGDVAAPAVSLDGEFGVEQRQHDAIIEALGKIGRPRYEGNTRPSCP